MNPVKYLLILVCMYACSVGCSKKKDHRQSSSERETLIEAYTKWINSLDPSQISSQYKLLDEFMEKNNKKDFVAPYTFWVEGGIKDYDPIDTVDFHEGREYFQNPHSPTSSIPTRLTIGDYDEIEQSRNRLHNLVNPVTHRQYYPNKELIRPVNVPIKYTQRLARKALSYILNDGSECYDSILNQVFDDNQNAMADSVMLNRTINAILFEYDGTRIWANRRDTFGPIPVYFNMGRLCPPKCPGGVGSDDHIGSTIESCRH